MKIKKNDSQEKKGHVRSIRTYGPYVKVIQLLDPNDQPFWGSRMTHTYVWIIRPIQTTGIWTLGGKNAAQTALRMTHTYVRVIRGPKSPLGFRINT